MIKGKRILITGGGGFIGTALAKRLAPENEITLLDLSFGEDAELPNVGKVVADITFMDSLLGSWIRSQHVVVHTAAYLGVQNVVKDAVAALETNFTGTANLLKYTLHSKHCEHFVSLSTSEIFGTNAFRVSENGTPMFPSILDPRWCYGVGKLAAEQLALGYYRECSLPVTVIRPFNVFGEGRRGDHALLQFAVRALRSENLIVHGTGQQVRAWCHIDDFCDAVLRCLESERVIGETFNIGNPGNTVSILDLANRVIRLCESSSRIIHQPATFREIQARSPDISKARELLGFEPRVALEDGLQRTISWIRENIDRFDPEGEHT
jgi:nucleoside-diphosphate-sugar epimerase